MDFGALQDNLPFIIAIAVLVVIQFFFRRKRKPEGTQTEIIRNLLTEIRLNHAMAETFSQRQKPHKFEVVSWQRNKNKLDFLPQPVQTSLSNAFSIAEDFNQQIDSTKKFKSAGSIVNIDAQKLLEPLAKSREGLEEWLQLKTGSTEAPTKYPGMFDDFLGGRR